MLTSRSNHSEVSMISVDRISLTDLTEQLKNDRETALANNSDDIEYYQAEIAADLSSGTKITKEQQDFLKAKFNDKEAVTNFKAEHYAKHYKWMNRKIFADNSFSLSLEVAYFFWAVRTSDDGVRDAGRVFFGTEVSDELANGAGVSTSALDFLSNISIFDPVSATKEVIVQYAEDQTIKEKVDAYVKELCSTKAPKVLARTLWNSLNRAVCQYHNFIGGYGTILGVTSFLGTGAGGILARVAIVYLTNVYYTNFLTPKFNGGLERHFKDEFITTKILKGLAGTVSKKYEDRSVTTPLNVAYTVACSTGLRAVGFAYMLPEIAQDLAATLLPDGPVTDLILPIVESKLICYSVIGYHTLASRSFGTYDKYFKDADDLRALLHTADPQKQAQKTQVINEILRLAQPGLTVGVGVDNFEFKNPGLERRVLQDASQSLFDRQSFKEKFAERAMTTFNVMMRLGEFGFLGYALGAAFLPELSILCAAGAALTLGCIPVIRAEYDRTDAARLMKHINDTILNPAGNAADAPQNKSKAALFALAVFICGGSNLSRFLGNVTFLNDEVVNQIDVQKQLSLAMATFVALESAFNGFDITIVNNVPTIALWGERIKNAFAYCCNRKQNAEPKSPELVELGDSAAVDSEQKEVRQPLLTEEDEQFTHRHKQSCTDRLFSLFGRKKPSNDAAPAPSSPKSSTGFQLLPHGTQLDKEQERGSRCLVM